MLFITLMQPKGKGVEAIKYLKGLKPVKGIVIKGVYFTYGRYDGVLMFEASNEVSAMKFIMETGFATQYTLETLIAVPAEEL
ncbi:MAG TPA: GYD domain-containing protein [Candidatus Bathyarchaeia archaeon]|nr:GYD domain-containing protein [Candidatus Bathyarchaeia archaeon]